MDPVGIANLALGWLGANPITSFDDPIRPAQLIGAQFAGLRRAVLEDRDWTFATLRQQLARDPSPPAFGYPSRYLIPSTVLRVITADAATPGGSIDGFAAGLDAGVSPGLDWAREGQFILANTTAPSLDVRAIVDVEDPALWTSGFCQALAARIAADLCIPICQDAALARSLFQLYMQKLRDAAANDGRQGRSKRLTAGSLALRRR